MRLGKQDWRLRVVEHEGQSLFGIHRVERDVSAARLENAEQADSQLQRSFDAQAHQGLRFYSQRLQVMGKAVGPLIQFAIGQLLVFDSHGNGIRCAPGLRFKQMVDTEAGREVGAGVVPLDQQLTAFGVGQNGESRNWLVGVGDGAFQQSLKVAGHAGDGSLVKQIGVVFDDSTQFFRSVFQGQGQVERGRPGV